MKGHRTRVAFSIGAELMAWEAEAMDLLMHADDAEVVGWMRPSMADVLNGGHRLPARLQRLISGCDPFAPAPPERTMRGAAAIAANECPCDVVLHLGGSRPMDTSGATRHWMFRHGDGAACAAFPPGLREALSGMPLAHFQLVDAASGSLVKECCVPVEDELLATAEFIVGLAKRWPLDRLREEAAAGTRLPLSAPERVAPLPEPSRWLYLLRSWRRLMGSAGNAPLDARGPWNIGVLHQPMHVLLQEDGSRNVRWLPNPSKGKSRMEPFGYLDADGDLNALYRKGDEDGNHGAIARVRPKNDNILKRSRAMLEEVNDASYPFVLQVDGAPHAVICDLEREEVRLRPVKPDNAGLEDGVQILADALHSPTLFHYQERWWLLGTKDPWPEALLHAYHGPSPQGPFIEHSCSPLKADARHARPAGTPFLHDGALYRPTLDASEPSRPAVWITHVQLLTPDAFSETPVRRITGFPATAYGNGVRTISAVGDLTLVDGLRSPVLDGSKANASRGRSARSKRRKP